jgi:virginiamycin B lyase
MSMQAGSRMAMLALWVLSGATHAAGTLQGQVVDTNGQPITQAQVIFVRDAGEPGASVLTVFSDADGRFHFPVSYPESPRSAVNLFARSLGYQQVSATLHSGALESLGTVITLQRVDNQIGVAPASAWLGRIKDRSEKSRFILDCIDCHQVPGPEQRNYAASIADLHSADPLLARTESWKFIVRYMNYLSNWEFARGAGTTGQKLDFNAVYEITDGDRDVATLARVFDDRLDHMSGYQWGAPLIANANTVIREYEVPHPNAVREAVLLGNPANLWIADVSANRLFSIDVATGKREVHEVPSKVLMSPHSLHRDKDGSLWVTPLFNSIVAHLDIKTLTWQQWALKTPDGKNPGIHDLSFGADHELLTDLKGRIWFSDIGNNAVGYFDPVDGKSEIWPAPASPGRSGRTSMYGLSMTKDRNQVWYSQLGNGTFGGFDIVKQQFIGPFQLPDRNAGPRRISITGDDVLYIALYGSGQIAEFDTRTRKMIGIYDLPDTGSAPYATTWDTVRKVVWVATSNGGVIYRFDPHTKKFGVLPLPREQGFLRMIDVDPRTGVLVTAYANIVDIVQGPRMALIIEPGDGAYPEKFLEQRPSGADTDGAKLFEQGRCNICHQMSAVSLGPPIQAIAARYVARKDVMTDVLARKIVYGGGGTWGIVPMVPNQWVSIEQARIMSAWILAQAQPR